MSTKETGPSADYVAYVFAAREQLSRHMENLEQFSQLISARPLTFSEQLSVERSIQVIVEVAIGASKHCLKHTGKPVLSQASACVRDALESISASKVLTQHVLGAVGMRNTLVHDYLNLDWARIEEVLQERKYLYLSEYINLVLERLLLKS